MSIDSQHPQYREFRCDWDTMRDTYRGERVIKAKRTEYLPATAGQLADGFPVGKGKESYDGYMTRAVFHGFIRDSIEANIGIMHHKPPTIDLPAVMEPLREQATVNGESLEILLRRINEEQLVTGRLGLLLDLDEETPTTPGQPLPYIAMYHAENIINWDNGTRTAPVFQNLNLVTLNESEFERTQVGDSFEWELEEKYRVLLLGDPLENEPKGQAVYRQGVFTEADLNFNEDALTTPMIRSTSLDEIPFVIINSKDVVPEPDDPPLLDLAKLTLAIYRGEADYRQSLFMQGQDTLITKGNIQNASNNPNEPVRVGAGAHIHFTATDGDAKFIGVDSKGLSEQREALENDKQVAKQRGTQLLDTQSGNKESGDALRIRVAAKSATLNQVALAGAFGLERLLKIVAKWIGANPDEVVVTPNLDFSDERMEGRTMVEQITAYNMGYPLTLEDLHRQAFIAGLTEDTFEETMAKREQEDPLGLEPARPREQGGDSIPSVGEEPVS